jgi:hypothetical protein
MSTYGPEVVFDLPSGDERVQDLLDVADIDRGPNAEDRRHFRQREQITENVATALTEVIRQATAGHVRLDGFELHRIAHEGARVKLTGSFGPVEDLADDFESFAQTGGPV